MKNQSPPLRSQEMQGPYYHRHNPCSHASHKSQLLLMVCGKILLWKYRNMKYYEIIRGYPILNQTVQIHMINLLLLTLILILVIIMHYWLIVIIYVTLFLMEICRYLNFKLLYWGPSPVSPKGFRCEALERHNSVECWQRSTMWIPRYRMAVWRIGWVKWVNLPALWI